MVKADPKDTDSATENKRNGFSDQEPVNTCQSSAAAQANELSFSWTPVARNLINKILYF